MCKLFFEELTPAQDRVAVRYAQGGTRASVARDLDLSIYTVNNHWLQVKAKLGVEKQIDLRNLYDKRKTGKKK